jgi:hypothetical protein
MREILTKCGYRCDLCPSYNENIKSEEDKKAVSDGWQKCFGFKIPPEEIGCAGCLNKGKLADSGCPVRPCVIEKDLDNCAYCNEYCCEKLATRLNFVDEYKKNPANISEEDYNKFVIPYISKPRLHEIRRKLGLE